MNRLIQRIERQQSARLPSCRLEGRAVRSCEIGSKDARVDAPKDATSDSAGTAGAYSGSINTIPHWNQPECARAGEYRKRSHTMKTITTYNGRVPQATDQIDVTAQWRQAVQGNAEARHVLLRRIMSRRATRPNIPRFTRASAM